MKKASVLFVCMGNICRSPAAEAVMSKILTDRDLDIRVESAGTEGYHVGDQPDPRMRDASQNRGYPMVSRARQVTRDDLKPGNFRLVVAMDHANLDRLRGIAGETLADHVRLFSDFLGESWPVEVPDPYYGGNDGFELVLDMLEAGCPAILEQIESK